jgi:hypothetical protein
VAVPGTNIGVDAAGRLRQRKAGLADTQRRRAAQVREPYREAPRTKEFRMNPLRLRFRGLAATMNLVLPKKAGAASKRLKIA